MEKINEDNEDFDKIKIFSSDDDKLKILGELLSNKSSRDIIKLLIDKEMYINEIAKKLDLQRSLVIHHLQKMEAIGLLEITNKKIARKGDEHRFFKIPSGMLIFPKQSEEEVNNGVLKRIFKEGIKFTVVGIAAISTWFGAISMVNKIQVKRGSSNIDPNEDVIDLIDFVNTVEFFSIPIITTLIVIGCGLFLILYSKKEKRSEA